MSSLLQAGKEAVVELLQRVMRAGSIRPAEFGTHWVDNGRWSTLVIRWGDEILKLGFQKKDLETWPRVGDLVPDKYRGRIQLASAWLMSLHQGWQVRSAGARAAGVS